MVFRATLDDQDNGDMTAIDFAVVTPFPQANKGKLTMKENPTRILIDLGAPPFPPCTQLEIVSLGIQDPDGKVFARIGAGTRP
jgi:hypothetical protein